MSGAAITITGLKELVAKYGKSKADAATEFALKDAAVYTAGLVKQRTPVVTGFLRSSITGDVTSTKAAQVFAKHGSGLYYAKWVEDGTGVHGQYHTPVIPTKASVMSWHPKTVTGKPIKKKSGGKGKSQDTRITRKKTAGQKAQHMFHDTYVKDQDKVKARFERIFKSRFLMG